VVCGYYAVDQRPSSCCALLSLFSHLTHPTRHGKLAEAGLRAEESAMTGQNLTDSYNSLQILHLHQPRLIISYKDASPDAAPRSRHFASICGYRQTTPPAAPAFRTWSKHPRLVGLPLRLNCASQRLVGKVWCTPLNLLVKVLPAVPVILCTPARCCAQRDRGFSRSRCCCCCKDVR
jgi:hypothetical protein